MQILIAAGVVVVAIAAWIGYRAWTVRHELALARTEISAVQAQAHGIIAGRGGGADLRPKLTAPAEHAANARAAAHDPLFRAVGLVPLLGAPFRSATGVADAASDIARTSLPALAGAADYWKIVRDSNLKEGVPVEFVAKASGLLDAAVGGLDRAERRLAGLPQRTWLGSADDARSLLAAEVSTLLDDLRPAAAVGDLAPAMLGRDGARHYLVAFENRAEARGTGGLLGALALVEARHGHLTVVRFTNNQTLPGIAVVPVGFHSDLAAQSPTLGIGTRWQNSNYGADFRDAGNAWAAMYTSIYRVPIDGVLGVDPDGMAALMSVTGRASVEVRGRAPVVVDAENVANFVERDEYRLPVSREVRKDIQQQIAQQVLTRLLSLETSPLDLVDSLTRAASLQHLLLMSLHPAEEKRLISFAVSGIVPATTAPYVRLTVNNAAGSKLDYYLKTSLRYTVTDCGSPRRVRIVVTLENAAPTGLPKIVGPQDMPLSLVQPQANLDLVAVYLTEHAWLLSARLDHVPVGTDPTKASPADGVYLRTAIDHGHPMLTAPLQLFPGQARQLELEVEEPASKAEPLTPIQPMTNQTIVTTDLDACRAGNSG